MSTQQERSSSATSSQTTSSESAREDSDSDAGSASSTNDSGYRFFDYNHRSLLYHPVGLPLFAALHGTVLSNLPDSYPVKAFPPEIGTDEKGDTILSEVCSETVFTEMNEPELTKRLHDKIKLAFPDQLDVETETQMFADGTTMVDGGSIDLALLSKAKEEGNAGADTSPLCVVGLGLSSEDWWTKFDQGRTFLQAMQQKPDELLCFNKPLLLTIITLDDSIPDFDIRMGVFLCTPKERGFRMSLIWHKQHFTMDDASKSFGLLLRILDHFQTQRSKEYKEESEYLGPNCVKAGDKVLRIYDTRFLPSERRPHLYLDSKCEGIVGGVVKRVLQFPEPVAAPAENVAPQDVDPRHRKNFFTVSPYKRMLVIATPYREGRHVAQHPEDFLPIIDHLEKLHETGYVHGDIRACNTAFPKTKGGPGCLIDFDFSGIIGEVTYPNGYVRNLDDGRRNGFDKKKIETRHDWYALGQLMFCIHEFYPPPEGQFTMEYFEGCRFWTRVKTPPSVEQIRELKSYLSGLQKKGWKVEPSVDFQILLDECK